MVVLEGIDVQEFQSPKIDFRYDCLLNKKVYGMAHGDPKDTVNSPCGIRVVPRLEIPPTFDGFIYVTQLCQLFEFSVRLRGGEESYLPKLNYPMVDGLEDHHNQIFNVVHGESFHWTNGKPSGECDPIFRDSPWAPFREDWIACHYKIMFQTNFQVSSGTEIHQDIKLLGSFKWDLDVLMDLSFGQWRVKRNLSDCTKTSIQNSFVKFDGDPGIDARSLPELSKEARKHFGG